MRTRSNLAFRTRWIVSLVVLPVILARCAADFPTATRIPDDARAIAIKLRVNVDQGTVEAAPQQSAPGMSLSLVGTDGIELTTSNLIRTTLSAKRSLVQFDVAITNRLSRVILTTPTFPAPPSGVQGVLLFPLEVTLGQIRKNSITASTDWDGAPHNFFNDAGCGRGADDCIRYEPFATPISPGATTTARTVGFEVDSNIESFEVTMLVAADLVETGPSILLSNATADFTQDEAVIPPAQTVQITNGGGGTLSGLTATVTHASGELGSWLRPELSSTTAPAVLTLSAGGAILGDGVYHATVTVGSSNATNTPQTIAVTLRVSRSPIANAIYVSTNDPAASNASNCGLGPFAFGGQFPCSSITMGINRAMVTGRREVRVADGRYPESVTLVNGISLLGGFNPESWQRHLTTTNTIIEGVSTSGQHDRTVIANGITSSTVFEGFVVRGSQNSKIGGNSYAIYVASSSANLTIRGNLIYGGRGGAGASGVSGLRPSMAMAGTGRPSNPAVYDAKVASGTGLCDPTNNRSHANGGDQFWAGDDVGGGNGGGNRCSPANDLTQHSALNGLPGQPGAGSFGGAGTVGGHGGVDGLLADLGSTCGVSSSLQAGGNGVNGDPGADGSSVSGATGAAGNVVAGHWVGTPGSAGIAGGNGGGGSGGGAGGGAYCAECAENHHRLGGHGGGGGAGGGGGTGGQAGNAGGGVFGIFVTGGSAPVISATTIVRGDAGPGGNGGAGGAGGAGGLGAIGGASNLFCTGPGGRGADGGGGGNGSGGGGGSGGGSFGIYTLAIGDPGYCSVGKNNTISAGSGGPGGPGGVALGPVGGAGISGALVTCSST